MQILPIRGIPEVRVGDDIAALILGATQHGPIAPGDIIVVSQKIVSKAEGAVIDLRSIAPSPFARTIADSTGKDPRLVEVILQQSRRIVKMARGVLITETLHGFICANSGVDASNVEGEENVSTLPADPDRSAAGIARNLEQAAGPPIAVIVSDSFNRPWREGSTNVAIGVAGMRPLHDQRGREDDFGHRLRSTLVNVADEIASAAQLVIGESGRVPAAIVRGWQFEAGEGSALELIRDPERDLFR